MRKYLIIIAIILAGWATTASALSVFLPVQGGTGTSTIPTLGKVLIGNNSGTYNLVSTSSLGISGAVWGSITGTLANQTDLINYLSGNYVPYTGANTNVDLGSNDISAANGRLNGNLYIANDALATDRFIKVADQTTPNTNGNSLVLFSGFGNGTGSGGGLSLFSGDGGATSGDAGSFNMVGGSSNANGFGGSIGAIGGTGVGAGKTGGNVSFEAGTGSGGANGGDIFLIPGVGSASGSIHLRNAATFEAKLGIDGLTGNRTFTFPNTNGTFALGTGIANQISYWVDANTLGALSTATYPSLTELSYIKGVTSPIQTQLDSKSSAFIVGNGYIYNATTSDMVGIGSTTPTATLTVSGSSTAPTRDLFAVASSSNTQFFNINSIGTVTAQGSVGIGTTTISTNAKLMIAGNDDSSANGQLRIKTLDPNHGAALTLEATGGKAYTFLSSGIGATYPGGFSVYNTTNGRYELAVDTNGDLVKPAGNFHVVSGKVGINNGNASSTLDVDARANNVILRTGSPGNWNDGLVLTNATNGYNALVYRKNNTISGSANMGILVGLYDGQDEYMAMSPLIDNTGNTITARRTDQAFSLRMGSTGDPMEFYTPVYFGQKVGMGTTTPAYLLDVVYNNATAGASGAAIRTKNLNSQGSAEFRAENSLGNSARMFKLGTTFSTYKNLNLNDIGFYNDTNGGNISILNDSSSGAITLVAGGRSSTGDLVVDTTGNVGVGTTTPTARVAITGIAGSSILKVASSTDTVQFEVDAKGHNYKGGTTPGVSSCGTSPSIIRGNDNVGRVQVGSVLATSCQIDFATAWDSPPVCDANAEGGITTGIAASSTATSVVFTGAAALTGNIFTYQCTGIR